VWSRHTGGVRHWLSDTFVNDMSQRLIAYKLLVALRNCSQESGGHNASEGDGVEAFEACVGLFVASGESSEASGLGEASLDDPAFGPRTKPRLAVGCLVTLSWMPCCWRPLRSWDRRGLDPHMRSQPSCQSHAAPLRLARRPVRGRLLMPR
jgi:hypothetical protein